MRQQNDNILNFEICTHYIKILRSRPQMASTSAFYIAIPSAPQTPSANTNVNDSPFDGSNLTVQMHHQHRHSIQMQICQGHIELLMCWFIKFPNIGLRARKPINSSNKRTKRHIEHMRFTDCWLKRGPPNAPSTQPYLNKSNLHTA